MTSPTIARASEQMPLLRVAPEFHCDSNASARNAYGSAAQEIAWAALGLRAIAINGNYEVCFDAELGGTFFEIKSVRHGCKVVLYDWRMKKEQAAGVPIEYVIIIHRLRKCRENIADKMLTAGISILRLPFARVHAVAFRHPLRQMKTATYANKRNGYTRAGYRDGYRNVPVSDLLVGARPSCLDFEFYGTWHAAELLSL